MRKFVKALHLIGLAMFLGSVFGHIAISLNAGADQDPETLLFARQAIEVAIIYVTLPGLILLLVTGVVLTVSGRFGVFKIRWLTLHQVLGVLIILNAAFILYPAGGELAIAAGQVVQGALSWEQFHAVAALERTFGPINVALTLMTVFVAVLKPGFGSARAKA
ncbi:DUF2269 family protein [Pelagibius sp. Alg239-R121]|uniref:DUF2269 family protein n=1 Tax=Pelagibius sp. Alg239-R121 TaxID=2993448 RepID=UPI0024A63094|nr:DUF2269 family protein [Pelagibius sp. Alg239-R121]